MLHEIVIATLKIAMFYLICTSVPVSFILGVILSIAYWTYRCRRPLLSIGIRYKNSALTAHILSACNFNELTFDPPWYIRNPHIQTILPYLMQHANVEFDREYIQMKDRGVIALDWVKSVSKNTRKRSAVVLILPGITSDATNVSYLCKLASNKGYKPVVYNQRGFGNTELTTAMLLNNCDPSDLRQTIQCIQDRHRLPVVSIAYGTGCDLLLSYLGEFGSSARIFGGVCISACLENEDRPSQTLKRVYNVLHLLKLKSIICRNYYALSKQINFAEMMKCWSLKEFDKIVFSRFYNYKSVDEFEEQMHPMRDIDEICAPLLFINSLDDPLDSKCDLLFELCDEFPNFMAIVSPTGGHCGFYDSLFDVSWSDRLALTYIQSVLYFGIK